jgi:hypothetical protein
VIARENAQSSLLTVRNEELVVMNERNKEEIFSLETIIYLFLILWRNILFIGCILSIHLYSRQP